MVGKPITPTAGAGLSLTQRQREPPAGLPPSPGRWECLTLIFRPPPQAATPYLFLFNCSEIHTTQNPLSKLFSSVQCSDI